MHAVQRISLVAGLRRSTPRRAPLAVAFSLLALLTATGCGTARVTSTTSASFVDTAPGGGDVVQLVSTQTGLPLRTLAPGQRGPLTIAGVARLTPDALLLTYATGPRCTSDAAGCDPQPGSCGGEVERLNLRNGAVTRLWLVPKDEQVSDAAPNPAGTAFAALVAPCVPSYFNQHLIVRSVTGNQSWTIGAETSRCHAVSPPAWDSTGEHLFVAYAPPPAGRPYGGPDGTCNGPGTSEVLLLDAHRDQPGFRGTVGKAPTDCSYESVAAGSGGNYAVLGCGTAPGRLNGPALLVRLSAVLAKTRSWSLGRCTDGNDISEDATGDVLVSAYLFCSPQQKQPTTVLDLLRGGSLRRVAASTGGGYLAYSDLAL